MAPSRSHSISLSAPKVRVDDGRICTLLQLHLLVVIFAATTILGRLASVGAPVLVTWRCLLAALGAFLWVVMMRDRRIWLGWEMVSSSLVCLLAVPFFEPV